MTGGVDDEGQKVEARFRPRPRRPVLLAKDAVAGRVGRLVFVGELLAKPRPRPQHTQQPVPQGVEGLYPLPSQHVPFPLRDYRREHRRRP